MGGRAVATIHGHAAALKRSVGNCQLFRKMPTIPPQGPMPLTDPVGMGLAVELLFHSLNAMPRIKGESHIQFDSMRQPRATFTSAWESSPIGIQEGLTFTKIVIPLAHRQATHQRRISHSVSFYETTQGHVHVGLGVISYWFSGGVDLHLKYSQSHCYIMPLPTGLV